MKKLSLHDVNVKNRFVLVRVDFNIPLTAEGRIADTTRIDRCLPTINYLLDNEAKVILMSHLGRPKGKVSHAFSLKPCAEYLRNKLQVPVTLTSDCIGEEVQEKVKYMHSKEIILLENLRFHESEEHPEKDSSFAKQLASLADIYVNDAFATSHRKHSSTYYVPQYLSKCVAGFLLEKEIEFLTCCLTNPTRPFSAIIGGAKIHTKIKLLQVLAKKVDQLLIGGGMAFTFLKALGHPIGNSLCEEEYIPLVKEFLLSCSKVSTCPILPLDILYASSLDENAETRLIEVGQPVPEKWIGVDIGDKTQIYWKKLLSPDKTIFWNGPLGVFEITPFAKGTFEIAQTLATLDATTVIGGGDSVAAIQKLHIGDQYSHLSTGGGASLEYIEMGSLPGIEALSDK